MAEEHEHIVSPAIYVNVLLALMFLLALTITAAFFDFDRIFHAPYWSMTIAVLIAITKAVLIILFFMHVKYGSRVTWAFASAAFVWLGIMMTLSMSDYVTRNYPTGSPKSSPMEPGRQIIRQPPQPSGVVGDAGKVAAPSRDWIARNVAFGPVPPVADPPNNKSLPSSQSHPLSSGR